MATPEDLILKNARAVAIILADRPAEADAIEELALWALDLQRANGEQSSAIEELRKALALSEATGAENRERGRAAVLKLEVAERDLRQIRGQLEADQSDLQKLRRSLAEAREALRVEIVEHADTQAKCVILEQNNALLADQRKEEVKRRKAIAADWERARQMQSMMMVPPISAKCYPLTSADLDFGDPSQGAPGEVGHVVHERFGTRRGVVIASPEEEASFDARSRLRNVSDGR